jgi:heme-degrading monooxygenase HmoA
MFSVLFEVHPRHTQRDAYLDHARSLRPALEKIAGFIDNTRYRSLTRDGWMLSVSNWKNEKALVRWRTHEGHHAIQERGRAEVLQDYRLRVGQVTFDSARSPPEPLPEERLDETQAGKGTTATLVTANFAAEEIALTPPSDLAEWLGCLPRAKGLVAWDAFDSVATSGNAAFLLSWSDEASARDFEKSTSFESDSRLQRVRVVRDYGMFDRFEAPRYFPDVRR